ncbi:hypothetical protein [Aestuariivivens sp. NBU2969]|uniref:hypothetical protein n=1 Tax=Aestuariivivens sp. NBU2969 TaxID=2873267 RepID=UPI001CBE219C|nr:hypothetical protein [Aestuariivivens sp. NBU2969]
MRKKFILLIVTLIAYGCNSSDETIETTLESENEFVILFPEAYPITSFELQNGNSIVIYENLNLRISEVDTFGKILWTKEHDFKIDILSNSIFILNNLIYCYSSGVNGIEKRVINFNGDIVESELPFSQGTFISKDNDFIFAFDLYYNQSTSKTEITYRKYSLNGNFISETSFESDYLQLSSNSDIIVKNNYIYIFDEDDFQNSPNFYENYFCKIYDLSGSLINTINSEIKNLKSAHSKLVLDNGNILMSIYNFKEDNSFVYIDDYDLRLYDLSGNLITTKTHKSYSNVLKINLLSNNEIAVAGGRDGSMTELKLSQFTVYDQNLNQVYSRNIGGYDSGDVFFKINESANYYYLLGRTFDYNGDYDLPNNSTGTDMFYFKLEK